MLVTTAASLFNKHSVCGCWCMHAAELPARPVLPAADGLVLLLSVLHHITWIVCTAALHGC